MSPKILIADDENSVREGVALALRRECFCVESYADGKSAWEALREGDFALAILDISMPLLEGTAVLSRVRAARLRVPVIFLTSRDEEIDRIAGLESGADDYIAKPFSMGELIARVRAVLRRSALPAGPAVTDASGSALLLCAERLQAFWRGRELSLTLTEFRMLERLLHRPGEIVSRDGLMQYAFPLDSFTSERSADSHIKRLRKKLSSAGAPESCIETMYGAGYRFREGSL